MPRGHPASFVTCKQCGSDFGWPISQRCRACIARDALLRFPFSAEHDRILRDAYACGTSKPALTEALNDAVRRIGYDRSILKSRAQRLGLTQDTRKPWTQQDIAFLREHSGQRSVKWIANRLKRGDTGVSAQMQRLRISCRVLEGYSREDVIAILGVSRLSVQRWIERGLLVTYSPKLRVDRITESSLRRLIFAHPELYSLRRVDEQLFKSMVFGSAAVFLGPDQGGRRENGRSRSAEAAA